MRVLVGVPAFRVPDLVKRCIDSIASTPADIMIVDNAADLDVKNVIQSYGSRVLVETNDQNRFCNGAWNQIMDYGYVNHYDVVGLGSSDAQLHAGWYEVLTERAANHKDEIWLPEVGEPGVGFTPEAVDITGGIAGYFSFLPKRAILPVYPIPLRFKHWYGDQHIFDTLRSIGWKVTVLRNMRSYHQQSAITAVTPEAYEAIRLDQIAWTTGKGTEPAPIVERINTGSPVRWRNTLR